MKELNGKLDLDNFELVDVTPIPMNGDRMVRLRTLEEAMQDFDAGHDFASEVRGFFIQVRPKGSRPTTPLPSNNLNAASNSAISDDRGDSYEDGPTINFGASPERQDTANAPAGATVANDGIYLADGKLNVPFLFKSADVLYASGDFSLARNVYRAILQSGERTGAAIYGLARCYESEGKFEEARLNFEEAIAYQPQPEAFKSLASILIRQNKDQEAAEVIERALYLKELGAEERYDMHRTAGNCWNRLQNWREAERHYLKALETREDQGEMRTHLGTVYVQQQRYQDAERCFQDVINANPQNVQALMGLGTCAIAQENQFAAHAWFARALQVDVKNPTAIFHLVKCAYAIKNYTIACRILEQYIQVAPVNVHLLYSLAGLQYHLDRKADASATCRRILELSGDHQGALDLLRRIETI